MFRQKDKAAHFFIVLNMLQSRMAVKYPFIYDSELLSATEYPIL